MRIFVLLGPGLIVGGMYLNNQRLANVVQTNAIIINTTCSVGIESYDCTLTLNYDTLECPVYQNITARANTNVPSIPEKGQQVTVYYLKTNPREPYARYPDDKTGRMLLFWGVLLLIIEIGACATLLQDGMGDESLNR